MSVITPKAVAAYAAKLMARARQFGRLMIIPLCVSAVSVPSHGTAPFEERHRSIERGIIAGNVGGSYVVLALWKGGRYLIWD